MRGKYTVIDGHVHTFPNDEISRKIIDSFNRVYSIEFENPGTGSIMDVIDNMRASGVDFTIMANFAPTKILHSNNSWTLTAAKENSSLLPLISFHPEMEGCFAGMLEGYIREGAKGIKMHPMAQSFHPDHPSLNEVYRLCGEYAFPVVFHCGRVSNARLNEYSDVDAIMPVIRRYPDMPVVLTHMADGSIEDVVRLAGEYTNVYFDTSIVITGYPSIMAINEPSWLEDSVVEDVINTIGADRVIFGSDYPWGSPKHDLDRIMRLRLSDEQREMILGLNAARVFKLDMVK
jgi:hypothetical protein